ncbi:unnamed protein product [Spirodela intermedia]|uniref:Uncharacterized protein n=1 Tax=Spirodela intermedia TaxID=51605 RepID=A0A7I8L0G4_SPIIN|nr:unnamed protein product [Spirodela intermedia]
MAAHDDEDDLGLLLSLRERVPETPPGSPRPSSSSRYESEDGSPKRHGATADMSAFRHAVEDYMCVENDAAASVSAICKPCKPQKCSGFVVEKFSGLRIRDLLLSEVELSNHFSDVRFINLAAIRNSMVGDTISGHWATVGVLTEKGSPKLSSSGKNFCVWKIGCLDESVVPVFLFGDAFRNNSGEPVGTVFAFFNSSVRKDGIGISLSVFSAGQLLKMGTSVDYGICRGKRKDGMPCTMVINKRQVTYCKYHLLNASQKYSTMRSELKGGNLRSTFRPHSLRGIHMVDPLKGKSNSSKSAQPVKVLSVDGLKRVLSNAGKVTTKSNSQGIRFLSEVTAKSDSKSKNPNELLKPNLLHTDPEKRRIVLSPSDLKMACCGSAAHANQHPEAKKRKTSDKLIELEVFSSEDEG